MKKISIIRPNNIEGQPKNRHRNDINEKNLIRPNNIEIQHKKQTQKRYKWKKSIIRRNNMEIQQNGTIIWEKNDKMHR